MEFCKQTSNTDLESDLQNSKLILAVQLSRAQISSLAAGSIYLTSASLLNLIKYVQLTHRHCGTFHWPGANDCGS